MQLREPGFSDTPPLPPTLEGTLLTQIPPYDNPNVDNVGLYDPVTTAWALGLGGDRQGDDALQWIEGNLTLSELVLAAAREAQSDSMHIDPSVIRSATAVLGSAMQQRETATGTTARAEDKDFAVAAKVLLGRYDRNLNPRQPRAASDRPMPTFIPRQDARHQGNAGMERHHEKGADNSPLDGETRREIGEIISHVSAFGFCGKVTPGTRMQVGKLPSLDICNPEGYGTFTYPSDERSPMQRWIETRALALGDTLRRVIGEPGGIPEGDNHFFTYVRTQDGRAWVYFGRHDTSGDVDIAGRPPGIQSCVFEMPVADAVRLESRIRQSPTVFRGFLAAASPGLDRQAGAPPRSPGLTTKQSRSVTVINYDTLQPTIESRFDGDHFRGSSATPLTDGKFYDRWPQAARRYEYPAAA
jgi:hypothetical protein